MSDNKIADCTEDTRKYGRRSTDNKSLEKNMPYSTGSLWGSIRNGVLTASFITALIGIGRFSYKVDTNANNIDENKQAIKELLTQNRNLIIVLKEQNIQQKESDKRFEQKFDDANDKLDRINDGVQKNRESIIILQNGKVSMQDNTTVNVAMR